MSYGRSWDARTSDGGGGGGNISRGGNVQWRRRQHWALGRRGQAVGVNRVQEGEKLETKASMGGVKMWSGLCWESWAIKWAFSSFPPFYDH